MKKFVLFLALSAVACRGSEVLDPAGWDPDVHHALSTLIRDGGSASCAPYAVFDCDNTSIIHDVSQNLTLYQIEQLRFGELAAENALVMDELHPEVRAWLDATRAILKEHFRRRTEEAVQERLRRWIDEKIYPFAPDDASEARAAFDAGVAEMRAQIDGFDSMPVAERGYLFSLIRKAVG